MRYVKTYFVMAVLAVVLSACQILGVPEPQTFNQRVLVARSNVTTIRQTATVLLNNKVISSNDAQNVQNSANMARDGLDVASEIYALNPKGGMDKLEASINILESLQRYLASKQKEARP